MALDRRESKCKWCGKTTDNEIIKAWECCVIKGSCVGCPYKKYWQSFSSQCIDMRLEDTFAIIASQKAEIERLKNEMLKIVEHDIPALAAKQIADTHTANIINHARAEATKECIKTIKEKLRDLAKIDFQGQYCYLIAEVFFDNIFEEMVGDV